MTISMKTNLSCLKINWSKSVSDLSNKEDAKDLLGAINGSLHWSKRFRKPDFKKKLAKLKKVKRLVLKTIEKLPDLTDEYGNNITRTHCHDMGYFEGLCTYHKATIWQYDDGLCAVVTGTDITLTYCEGSVTIYRGSNSASPAHDAIRFWVEEG